MSACFECGAPYEKVRPGKHQPTCKCDLRCPLHHFALYAYNDDGVLVCPACRDNLPEDIGHV